MSARTKRSVSVLAAILCLLAAPPVLADDAAELEEEDFEEAAEDADEDSADLQRAQDHFDTGADLYYQGEYSQAAVEFRRAHQIHPHPMFMYNFALATKQLDRLDDTLDAALEAEAMDQQLPPEQQAGNRAMIHGAQLVLDTRESSEEIAADLPDIDPPEAEDEFGPVGWIGLGAIALGTAGGVAGAVTHYRVRGDRQELEERREVNPDAQAIATLESRVSSRETARNALYLSAAGLVTFGTGFVIWENMMGPDNDASALDVSIGPTNASISLTW